MTQLFRWAMGVLAFVVTSALAPTSAQASGCGRLCHAEFWKTATPEDVQAELAKGSDPHARGGFFGGTPLHFAAANNDSPAVVSMLLAVGADVQARTRSGSTPLHAAAQYNGNTAAWYNRVLSGTADVFPGVVSVLLKAGAKVEVRDKTGRTPLHVAAWRNENPAVVSMLLEAGAKVEARDKDGKIPLYLAAEWNRNPAVVSMLLEAGAKVEARDKTGWAPLHGAARFNDNPAVVVILLDAGADPKAKTGSGRTAFDLIQENEGLKDTDAYWRLHDLRFE